MIASRELSAGDRDRVRRGVAAHSGVDAARTGGGRGQGVTPMIPIRSDVRVWVATGHTDSGAA